MGYEVAKYKEQKRADLRKKNIGFVFQSFNLIDELAVYENVELPLLYLNVPAAERKKRWRPCWKKYKCCTAAIITPNNYRAGNSNGPQ